MSIFAEYKHGLIDKDEFRAAAAREFAGDNDIREPDDEDEGEPPEEVSTVKWHTERPPCSGEYYVTIAYDFTVKGGIQCKGRCISIAEYDRPACNWIYDETATYFANHGARVIAWAVLPEPYTGAIKEVTHEN